MFSDGRAVGLLDFDFAAPGRVVWDVAMTARYWVPLVDPESAAGSGRAHLDPFARVRLLADSYGLADDDRRSFTTVLMEIERVALRFVLDRVRLGEPAFVRMWADLGGDTRHRRKMGWLEQNLPRLDAVLSE